VSEEPAESSSESSSEADGTAFVRASWIGTVVHAVLALLAAAAMWGRGIHTVVACALFVGGVLAFVIAFFRAVGRSRYELIGVTTLFFLGRGVAPKMVVSSLRASLAVEVIVALAASIARPYTSVAAAWLVPLWGLGLMGLYGARFGRFPTRQ
jgi:hypothetical protein